MAQDAHLLILFPLLIFQFAGMKLQFLRLFFLLIDFIGQLGGQGGGGLPV